MRKVKYLLPIVCVLLLNAQTSFGNSGVGLDLLVNISPFSSNSFSFYIPFVVGDKIIIEPEIGFGQRSETEEPDDFRSGMFKEEDESKSTSYGLGVFYILNTYNNIRSSIGLRAVMVETETTREYSYYSEYSFGTYSSVYEESSKGFYWGPTYRAEYMFSDRFSLLGEFRFLFSSMEGEIEEIDGDERNTGETESSSNGLFTLVGFRWYF